MWVLWSPLGGLLCGRPGAQFWGHGNKQVVVPVGMGRKGSSGVAWAASGHGKWEESRLSCHPVTSWITRARHLVSLGPSCVGYKIRLGPD